MSAKQQSNENLTQSKRFSAAFTKISVDLSTEDRKEILVKADISLPTLNRYLSGRIDSLDTAAKILTIAKELVAKRELILEGLQQD